MMLDGRLTISESGDKTLKVWDLESGQTVAILAGDVSIHACAVGPDGRTIVAGDTLGRVHFLRLENLPGLSARG